MIDYDKEKRISSIKSDPTPTYKDIDWLIDEMKKLQDEGERYREALDSAKTFIEYARYELEAKLVMGSQFPSQECADKEIAKIQQALKPYKEK